MTVIINASPSNGLTQTADGSGVIKIQSNGVTTNALAWVNFNGTTASPSTINSAYNVGSVTKNSTGNYTLNFTSAMSDSNYAVFFGICGGTNATNASFVGSVLAVTQYGAPSLKSTTQVQIITVDYTSTVRDFTQVYVAIFGN